ncbi:hypothetical protein HHK36_024310 [Tetracentron sinense]|uniref:Mediator of RNA polymerase II transcription subunit 25 n=1 Tax=Tetracentron sinense TaxID=13715 RepID=A0A835D4I6_TETSI|nr:hypothetical protein HHK36_024310 [Tetracentron sinense]
MAEKQLIVAIEGTAAMGPFWHTILTDYLEKIIRCFVGNELTGQKPSGANIELSLVVFNAHGSSSACLVQRSGWTRDMEMFLQWLSAIPFTGGGFSEAAIGEGLAEALMMFSLAPNGSQTQQNVDGQRHCILVAASNPYPLPTPVYRPQIQNLEQSENIEVQTENRLSDAETVAKSFAQCLVSLSVISPKQLPKLRGKRNARAADPSVDIKNPQFLVLLSENFMEARAALSRPGSLASNQSPVKMDTTSGPPVSGPPPTSIPSVNGSIMNRQPMPAGNIPTATVKVEPNTVTSMVSGPAFSHLPSVSRGASQAVPSLQTSSPSSTSQEMITNGDNVQEFKPTINGISQPPRPVGPAAANVSILNNLSQARQVMSSATLTGGSPIGLQTMGGTHMAMHMSNMISSGMASSGLPAAQNVFSSGQSTITSLAGSGTLAGTSQAVQNTALGSFTSATSNISGNSNLGISQPLANLQGAVSTGQSLPGMSQGNLSGAQMVQNGIGMNQNIMNGLGPSGISSGSGTMIPTPGMSQQVQAGIQSLGVTNSSAANMSLSQQTSGAMQSGQPKYMKVWEGNISGQRQGQPVFITRLEGYRNAAASETQYVGKADFLVFRALNQHGFLGQLQEKKLISGMLLRTSLHPSSSPKKIMMRLNFETKRSSNYYFLYTIAAAQRETPGCSSVSHVNPNQQDSIITKGASGWWKVKTKIQASEKDDAP